MFAFYTIQQIFCMWNIWEITDMFTTGIMYMLKWCAGVLTLQ